MSARRRPEKEVQVMFEVYPSNWPMAVDSTDPRNQFHQRALDEARATSDYRTAAQPAPAREPGLVGRLRLAIAGGAAPATQLCTDCPA
jgi:hypothetical protein